MILSAIGNPRMILSRNALKMSITFVINLFGNLFGRYQHCFKDVHLRFMTSSLEVSCMLQKIRKNRSERHHIPLFPPSLIWISNCDGVVNIYIPGLQVNLQRYPMCVTNHNENDLNKNGKSSTLHGEHLNNI